MKFYRKQRRWHSDYYVGKNKGFEFSYRNNGNGWSVIVSHTTKDIRFNSLWNGIEFTCEGEIQDWCEKFDYAQYQCLGKDVIK